MKGKILTCSSRKRPFVEDLEDGESTEPRKQKRVRFPEGKIKVNTGDDDDSDYEDELLNIEDDHEDDDDNVDEKEARQLAAQERAKRRRNLISEEEINDASDAEVSYEENKNFVEDEIQIEPFNLNKERENGYFDSNGNYIEYVSEKQIKDAWLDSIEVDPHYAGLNSSAAVSVFPNEDNEYDTIELTSDDIGMITKRVASVLEPGETVLQALTRLKGGSNKRKEKMSTEIQLVFDKLTEDANKLLEHGEHNVYYDKREVFKGEAEGVCSVSNTNARPDAETPYNDADGLDMFRSDDDANTVPKQDDYVYDETSGYYYNNSSGYYYDASTGLYCYAASGKWYSYNGETGRYDEIPAAASNNVDGNCT